MTRRIGTIIAATLASVSIAFGVSLLVLDQKRGPDRRPYIANPDSEHTIQLKPLQPVLLPKDAARDENLTGAVPQDNDPRTRRLSILKTGLDFLTNDEANNAMSVRDTLPDGAEKDVLSWAIAMSGLPDVPAIEIERTRESLAEWPGLDTLRKLEERVLLRDRDDAARILDILGNSRPETAEGTVALANALVATGRADDAKALIAGLWATDPMYPALEQRILSSFADVLTPEDHKKRMLLLLFAEKPKQASVYAVKSGTEKLQEAFAAVLAKSGDAAKKITDAEADFGTEPALLYAKIRNLRQKHRYSDAAKLLDTIPHDDAKLVNPGEWWTEQRIVSRGLADAGKAKLAYQVVANAVASTPEDKVEAEFHAGWFALRLLRDPDLAAPHFAAILRITDRPVALARGFYWLGRTEEARKSGKAADDYQRAATLSGTFYGQLAAARLGQKNLSIKEPQIPSADETAFHALEPVQAMAILTEVGHGHRAQRLIRAMAETLNNPSQLILLQRMAMQIGGPAFGLEIGKMIYGRGFNLPTLAWPVGAIPDSADTTGSGEALAYAVARQESAFNPGAVSPAQAFGLLQLLPQTAKQVAGRHGMTFNEAQLLSDPGYNATLGSHYLGEQISNFDGSYVLTLVAYNAGPKRVDQWIKKYGDPRGKPIAEVVDWIERIPFSETRAYVQRVMENYQVYKARLGEISDIEADLISGRRS